MRLIDLVGQVFGNLTVLAREGTRGGRALWRCKCACVGGGEVLVPGNNLRRGYTRSCGCLQRRGRKCTHGKFGTKVYSAWSAMLGRCCNPKNASYKNYGGRGIKVCRRWEKFENFYEDMGDPEPGMTLERENTNRDYSPGNCTWATRKEQTRNRRITCWIKYKRQLKTLGEWAEILGVGHRALRKRLIRRSMNVSAAFDFESKRR